MGELTSLGNGTSYRLIEISKPALRPRRDLAPIPHQSPAILGSRGRKAVLVGDLVGALLADAEELRYLDDLDRGSRHLARTR